MPRRTQCESSAGPQQLPHPLKVNTCRRVHVGLSRDAARKRTHPTPRVMSRKSVRCDFLAGTFDSCAPARHGVRRSTSGRRIRDDIELRITRSRLIRLLHAARSLAIRSAAFTLATNGDLELHRNATNLYVVRRSLGIILLNLQPNNGTSNRREHEPMAKQAKNFMH